MDIKFQPTLHFWIKELELYFLGNRTLINTFNLEIPCNGRLELPPRKLESFLVSCGIVQLNPQTQKEG